MSSSSHRVNGSRAEDHKAALRSALAPVDRLTPVVGSIVCDSRCQVMACTLPDTVRVESAQQVCRSLWPGVEAIRERGGMMLPELDLTYSDGRLFVRHLGAGMWVVVSKKECDLAVLRVTLRSASRRAAAVLRA